VEEATLATLALDLFHAKKAEDEAKKKRISIEESIAALVETGVNGSKTVKAGDLKLSVKRALSYTADIDGIRDLNVEDGLPLKPTEPVPAGWAFDEKAYEALSESNPQLFKEVARFVTTKPRKVSVELKL
jgi:hypothetical protein